MLRLALKISAFVLVFAMGRGCAPTKVETVEKVVKVPGPIQYVLPLANQGVEYIPGYRQVNEDAAVPILTANTYELLCKQVGWDPSNGFLEGAYVHADEPGAMERIIILGNWSRECETALHEFVHMLETNMPDQAWRIRKQFHRLCSNRFRIDSMDLVPELPEPTTGLGVTVPAP